MVVTGAFQVGSFDWRTSHSVGPHHSCPIRREGGHTEVCIYPTRAPSIGTDGRLVGGRVRALVRRAGVTVACALIGEGTG